MKKNGVSFSIACRKLARSELGQVMLFVTGLIAIITVVIASTIAWNLGRSLMEINENDLAMQESEQQNVNKIIQATIRNRLAANDPTPFDITVIQNNLSSNNLTQAPYQGAKGGFELSSISWQTTPSSQWLNFANNSFFTDPKPNPRNPLSYLWHIPYTYKIDSNTSFLLNPLVLAGSTKTNVSTTLPSFRPVPNNFPNAGDLGLQVREIPSSQIQFTAVDTFQCNRVNFPIVVNGTALAPYGVNITPPTAGSMIAFNNLVVPEVPPILNNSSCFSASSIKAFPSIAVSWMLDPYLLPEAGSDNNSFNQKYYGRALTSGGQPEIFKFDGQQINQFGANPWMNAISVQTRHGATRVVVDAAQLLGVNQIYIDCTTPLAKQRGVVVIGSKTTQHQVDSILTNGALFLEDEQSNVAAGSAGTSIIVGTSYGGIVFTGSDATVVDNDALWDAYIVCPIRPPYDQPLSASSAAGSSALDNSFYQCDTISITGATDVSGTQRIGFSWGSDAHTQASNRSAYLELSSGGTSFNVVAYVNQTPVILGTFSAGGTIGSDTSFTLTYSRANNSFSGQVKGANFFVSLNGLISRIEANQVFWESAVGASRTIKAQARSGGCGLYSQGLVNTVTLNGGIMVGQLLTGNLKQLTISPSTNPDFNSLMALSDRLLLFCP